MDLFLKASKYEPQTKIEISKRSMPTLYYTFLQQMDRQQENLIIRKYFHSIVLEISNAQTEFKS
jgi:hypothetical protein